MKTLYIIAGCNGAGKTTSAFHILPDELDCLEYVNADEIAKGLSPLQPETVAIEAARIMLNRIQHLLNQNLSFAFETTLATKSYVNLIHRARDCGYKVIILFLWLSSVELAKKRVAQRVSEGGHNINVDVIERRYIAGIKNLFKLYINNSDQLLIYHNDMLVSELIYEKSEQGEIIHNKSYFKQIKDLSI